MYALKSAVLTILSVFLVCAGLLAQTNNTESKIDSLALLEDRCAKVVLMQQISADLQETDWHRALHYLELAKEQSGNCSDSLQAQVCIGLARLFNNKDILDVSLEYYLKALELLDTNTSSDDRLIVQNNLAIIYARLKNKDKALSYFQQVYQYMLTKNDSFRLAQVLNNMGTLCLESNPDSSLSYYMLALNFASNSPDSVTYVYLYTNIARASFLSGKQPAAQNYFNKAVKLARTASIAARGFAYSAYSEYALETEDYKTSLLYASLSKDLLRDDYYNFNGQNTFKTLYKASLGTEDYKSATSYFEQYDKIRDSLNVEEKAVNVERLKLQQEYKSRAKIQQLNEEKRKFKYYLVGALLAVVILILLMALLRFKNKIASNKLKQELLEARELELEHRLAAKNKILIAKAMTEMNRTDIINGILQDLKEVKLKAIKKETQEAIDIVLLRLQRDLNTDTWEEFEMSFEQVHQSFYTNLQKQHPDLTAKDRRLCSLLYLNLTSKEISQITGQSFKAVENARTRLRKKLDLTNTNRDTAVYLNSLGE